MIKNKKETETEHRFVPLPEKWHELTAGELVACAMDLGVGLNDPESKDRIRWSKQIFAAAIDDASIERFGKNSKQVDVRTIQTWREPNSRGPQENYFLQVMDVVAPDVPEAKVNLPWRKALLQTRSNDAQRAKRKKRKEYQNMSFPTVKPVRPKSDGIDLSSQLIEYWTGAFLDNRSHISMSVLKSRTAGYLERYCLFHNETSVDGLAYCLLRNIFVRIVGELFAERFLLKQELCRDEMEVLLGSNLSKQAFHFSYQHFFNPSAHGFVKFLKEKVGIFFQEYTKFDEDFTNHFYAELLYFGHHYRSLIDFLSKGDNQQKKLWSTIQFKCHQQWLNKSVHKPLLSDPNSVGGEPFSLNDIYLDLPLEPDIGDVDDDAHMDDSPKRLEASELFADFVKSPWKASPSKDNFLLIRGFPGTGKSSITRKNLDVISKQDQNLAVLFINLQRHGPFLPDDQSLVVRGASPEGFVQNGGGVDVVEAFETSAFSRLLVVLDGLDELGSQQEHQEQVAALSHALKLVDERKKIKPIKFIVAGRHQAFAHITYPQICVEGVFRLIGTAREKLQFNTDGPRIVEDDLSYTFDLRMEWFEKFSKYKFDEPKPLKPKVFESHFHQLAELTYEPLLLFLLFRLGENLSKQLHHFSDHGKKLPDYDRIFEMGEETSFSRNDLYQMIIWSIRKPTHREKSQIERPYKSGGLPENEFENVLTCLALPAWRNGTGRRATVREFLEEAERRNLREQALRFVSSARGYDPTSEFANLSLLSVFYFQGFRAEGSIEDEFEFTHKSFSNYLVGTFLFQEAIKLVQSSFEQPLVENDPRILDWISLIGQGEESIEILQFIQEEGIRYRRKRTVLFETPDGVQHLYPKTGQELPIIEDKLFEPLVWKVVNASKLDTEHAKKASRFLVAIWNAVVAGEELTAPSEISPTEFTFKELHEAIGARARYEDLSQINSSLVPIEISKTYISYWVLSEQDLSDLNMMNATFTSCDLNKAVFASTLLNNSGFNHCDLKNAFFSNCDLTSTSFYYSSDFDLKSSIMQSSILENCQFANRKFEHVDFSDSEWIECLFEGCVFRFCDLTECILDRCHFVRCRFEFCDFSDFSDSETKWENCNFLNSKNTEKSDS